jgi:uncharacterized membrane protein
LDSVAQAPWLARLHLIALAGAAVLGAVQLLAPKGRLSHRLTGWTFAGLLAAAVGTALFLRGDIEGLPVVNGWSPVHGMLALAVALLPLGIVAARRKDVLAHRAFMGAVFCALLTAVLFSTAPGGSLNQAMTAAPQTLAKR